LLATTPTSRGYLRDMDTPLMVKDGVGHPPRPWIGVWVSVGLLSVAFSLVLLRLFRLSFGSEFESYIPLIPVVSFYLLYLNRGAVAVPSAGTPERIVAAVLGVVSAGLLVVQGMIVPCEWRQGAAGSLTLPTVSFVTAVIGCAVLFRGLSAFKRSMFPWVFLYLMVPIPEPVAHGLRVALQQGSADVAYALFRLTGTPVFRDGLNFSLPGLTIEIAEECSGIHSTLVLLISSMVAGHLFLRKRGSCTLLALMVIPVGLIRNGIRVVTLSLLTVYVDPRVIDSPLHHRGGPVFFVLSLGMLATILWGLRRYEKRRSI